MTRDETKKCIETMQAYVDGREIEVNDDGQLSSPWIVRPADELHWNWYNHAYRIKEDAISAWANDVVEKFKPIFEALKQDPQLFDWRGKNIQWVRPKHGECSYRIVHCSPANFSYVYAIHFEKKAPLINTVSEENFDNFEWSEDNATWRKFE